MDKHGGSLDTKLYYCKHPEICRSVFLYLHCVNSILYQNRLQFAFLSLFNQQPLRSPLQIVRLSNLNRFIPPVYSLDLLLQQRRGPVHLGPVWGSIPQGQIDYSGRRGRRMWRRGLSFILPVKQDEEPQVKYSATSRLGEGVEMSKQLSQQIGRSCSSSYGLVYLVIRKFEHIRKT